MLVNEKNQIDFLTKIRVYKFYDDFNQKFMQDLFIMHIKYFATLHYHKINGFPKMFIKTEMINLLSLLEKCAVLFLHFLFISVLRCYILSTVASCDAEYHMCRFFHFPTFNSNEASRLIHHLLNE